MISEAISIYFCWLIRLHESRELDNFFFLFTRIRFFSLAKVKTFWEFFFPRKICFSFHNELSRNFLSHRRILARNSLHCDFTWIYIFFPSFWKRCSPSERLRVTKQNSSSLGRFYTNISLGFAPLSALSFSGARLAGETFSFRYVTDIRSAILRKFYKKLMSSSLPSQWRCDSGLCTVEEHVISLLIVLEHSVMQCWAISGAIYVFFVALMTHRDNC